MIEKKNKNAIEGLGLRDSLNSPEPAISPFGISQRRKKGNPHENSAIAPIAPASRTPMPALDLPEVQMSILQHAQDAHLSTYSKLSRTWRHSVLIEMRRRLLQRDLTSCGGITIHGVRYRVFSVSPLPGDLEMVKVGFGPALHPIYRMIWERAENHTDYASELPPPELLMHFEAWLSDSDFGPDDIDEGAKYANHLHDEMGSMIIYPPPPMFHPPLTHSLMRRFTKHSKNAVATDIRTWDGDMLKKGRLVKSGNWGQRNTRGKEHWLKGPYEVLAHERTVFRLRCEMGVSMAFKIAFTQETGYHGWQASEERGDSLTYRALKEVLERPRIVFHRDNP